MKVKLEKGSGLHGIESVIVRLEAETSDEQSLLDRSNGIRYGRRLDGGYDIAIDVLPAALLRPAA